ncbi:CHAP domain-containing protein [Candidatus Saccharibacteria bacterium]|nr:CHAP domain-containing protein [Candidatus Saccharibacteria bacterium]
MVMLRRLRIISVAVVVGVISTIAIIINSRNNIASAVDYCTSDACKAAAAREAEARQKAAEAASAARDLEQVVQGLELEIFALEAKIKSNEAIAADLAVKIQINEEKLEAQKSALASLLVKNYFDSEPETIMILAGSKSISDLAEYQARAETVKQQINLSAKNIKAVKEELEAEKGEVDRLVVDQNNQKEVIKQKRIEQKQLIAKYQDNAENFTAEAEAARVEKARLIAQETAANNSNGYIGTGSNTYPWQGECPGYNLWWQDQWGYVCQCVHYAGYKAYEFWGADISYWGNAYSWDEAAVARGYIVDRNPAPFTVAVSNYGAWGHVMWVESVNGDGTINISEYNNPYSSASGMEGDYGFRSSVSTSGLVFIHFDKRAW